MAPGRNTNGDSMNTNRTIKTSTALRNALAAAQIAPSDAKRIIAALKGAAKDGIATSGAVVTHNVDGFVPNSYRYSAPGRRIRVEIAPFGVSVHESRYDRKRPNGNGSRIVVRAMRPGMRAGTPLAI